MVDESQTATESKNTTNKGTTTVISTTVRMANWLDVMVDESQVGIQIFYKFCPWLFGLVYCSDLSNAQKFHKNPNCKHPNYYGFSSMA